MGSRGELDSARDRIVQGALRHVLEPIFEAEFASLNEIAVADCGAVAVPLSHGASTATASDRGGSEISNLKFQISEAGHHWVVDLSACDAQAGATQRGGFDSQFGGQRQQPLLLLHRPLHPAQHRRDLPLLGEGRDGDDFVENVVIANRWIACTTLQFTHPGDELVGEQTEVKIAR